MGAKKVVAFSDTANKEEEKSGLSRPKMFTNSKKKNEDED